MVQTGSRPRVVAGLRLVSLVGKGGEGEVWEARGSAGERRALKLIRPDSLVAPGEVTKRGKWLLTVDHAALVKVHRTGALRGAGLDGWGFVEMDYVDGETLQDAPADPDVLTRLDELADALDCLHTGVWSEGVPLVHRDVKPANLIHTPDDRLVLVDHSTLRALDNPNITRIGTPVFVAPEVITGTIGPAADIYSFAVTAVALLTGARRQELADLIATPGELDVPPGIRAALAAEPARRPTSCKALLDPQIPLVTIDQLDNTSEWVGSDAEWAAAPPSSLSRDPATDVVPLSEHTAFSRPPPGAVEPADIRGYGHPDDHADIAWMAPPAPTAHAYAPRNAPLLAPPRIVGWILAFGVVVGAVVTTPHWAEPQQILIAGGVAGAVHLLMHILANRSLMAAVFLPPVATALLFAGLASAAPGRLRDWARPLLLGAMTPVTLGLLGHARALIERYSDLPLVDRIPVELVPYVETIGDAQVFTLVGVLAVLVSIAAVRIGGLLLRVLVLPIWALGAVVLLAGGLVLVLPAVLVGRAGDVIRAMVGVFTGIAAFVSPARAF